MASGISEGFKTVYFVASTVSKSLKALDAGLNCYLIIRKPGPLQTRDAMLLAANGVFMGSQVLDIGFSGMRYFAPDVSIKLLGSDYVFPMALGLRTTTAVTDIARNIISPLMLKRRLGLEDSINVLAVVIFRGFDILNVVNEHPGITQEVKSLIEKCQYGAQIADATLCVYTHRDSLKAATKIVSQFIFNSTGNIPVYTVRAQPPANHPAPPPVFQPQANPLEDESEAEMGKAHQLNYELQDFMTHWEELESIPKEMQSNERLSVFTCSISGKPVRFPVRPAKGAGDFTVYEKATLISWLCEHPDTPPEYWPEGVPLYNPETRELNIIEDVYAQWYIDDALDELSKEFKCIAPTPDELEEISQITVAEATQALHLEEIPHWMGKLPVFASIKCLISGKAVRFAVHANHIGVDRTAVYELSTLKLWLQSGRGKPNGWPEGCHLFDGSGEPNVVEATAVQAQINRLLESIKSEFLNQQPNQS